MNKWIISTALYLLIFTACKQTPETAAPSSQNLTQEDMQWWTDAKFGMFIHWGPYSVLGGEWEGQQLPVGVIAEWIMQKLEIPVEDYRKIAATFNPVKFNADEWTDLASQAGMKYLVITSKHHDGFAMYNSQVSDYNIVDYTPFGRDPLAELSSECGKKDLRFCFYYSHREDWEHPYAYGNYWDFETSQQDGFNYDPDKPFTTYLEEKAKPQLRELLTNYGPIGLVWFDRGMFTREQGMEFVNLVREIQPKCIINGRVGNYNLDLIGDYQNMSDNGMPPGGVEEYWETPQTLNETWGYSKFDQEWKSTEEVISRLVEIVSKGGNYLLNIGPRGDGSIPEASVKVLKEVGSWMEVNHESIYGTTASPLNIQSWGFCTARDSLLYLHVLDWPVNGELEITGLRNQALDCYLLASKRELNVERRAASIIITLPEEKIDDYNTVIALQVSGEPESDPPVINASGQDTITLGYMTAVTTGSAVKRYNRKGQFFISKWNDPEDEVSWILELDKSMNYRAIISYSAPPESEGERFIVESGEQQLEGSIQSTGEPFQYQSFDLGGLKFQEPGKYQIRIRPANEMTGDLMYFHSLMIYPE
jgi:alpha-L-fucosidase